MAEETEVKEVIQKCPLFELIMKIYNRFMTKNILSSFKNLNWILQNCSCSYRKITATTFYSCVSGTFCTFTLPTHPFLPKTDYVLALSHTFFWWWLLLFFPQSLCSRTKRASRLCICPSVQLPVEDLERSFNMSFPPPLFLSIVFIGTLEQFLLKFYNSLQQVVRCI